jgi:cytochrome-b5 reductase
MDHNVTLLMTEFVTHDVKRFIVSRPERFSFQPGQGVELAIDRPEWRDQGRPFTPTCLPDDRVLEFIIKAYPDHHGVTEALHRLVAGTGLLLSDPFGTIAYQGRGTFIAGGAGITPFLAILRQLHRNRDLAGHSLIFSNKTPADVICERELRHRLGERCHLICTQDGGAGYASRRLDKAYLAELIDDFSQHFYLCGPPPFMDALTEALTALGADPEGLVFER